MRLHGQTAAFENGLVLIPSEAHWLADYISYAYYSIQTRPETFIPYAGALVGGADSENSVVMINFDKRGILQSYTSSQGSTGAGFAVAG